MYSEKYSHVTTHTSKTRSVVEPNENNATEVS